ncbi:MAG: leucine-rich repeat domain-containing protein [Bacteroidales bacterium]
MKKTLLYTIGLLLAISLNAQIPKTLNVTTAGSLSNLLTPSEKATITNLIVSGCIDARDIKCMRDEISNLESLDISSTIIQEYSGNNGTSSSYSYPAMQFPANAFYQKTVLKSVKLPDGITSIDREAFEYCFQLETINIPDSVTSIGTYAFDCCLNLKGNITFPNSIISIGYQSFNNCPKITSITFGNSALTILNMAFGCNALRIIHCLSSTPPILGTGNFTQATSAVVYVPAGAIETYRGTAGWDVFTIATEKRIEIDNPIAGGVASTIINAGMGPLSSITHLTVTGKLNSIDILQMKTNMLALTELNLEKTTITNNTLPNNAFEGKTALTSVKLPTSLIAIGDFAFSGCTNITDKMALDSSLTSLGQSAFKNCSSMTGDLIIPNGVSVIESSTFSGCSNLNGKLIIPKSVITIESNAFSSCGGLTGGLSIPNSVKSIGISAFENCIGLSDNLILPNEITIIPDNAFLGCGHLTGSITIPNSVTSIGANAFKGCSHLEGGLTIPNSITSIGISSFQDCKGLTGSLFLPNAIIEIPNYAFSGCSGLSGLLFIPISIKSIGNNAFDGCSNLTTLYINKNTTTINDYAFNGCKGLQKISSTRSVPPSISSKTFWGVNFETCSLEVPIGSSLTYLSTNYWNQFVFLKETSMAETYGITVQIGAGGVVTENNLTLSNNAVISVESDSTKTFTIMPNPGYKISTLVFNGENVKSQIENNQFTTPTLLSNVTMCVTFEKIQYFLTIKSAECGSANLICEYGSTPSFSFTPSDGWKINMSTYNGMDITNSLINGIFKVPEIFENSVLTVSFELITSIKSNSNSPVNVYTTETEIIVDGIKPNETICLYTIDGIRLQKLLSKGSHITISAPQGSVYLVKTALKTFKVAL